jgi:hypothetical protein
VCFAGGLADRDETNAHGFQVAAAATAAAAAAAAATLVHPTSSSSSSGTLRTVAVGVADALSTGASTNTSVSACGQGNLALLS